jgi:branched-chain amino acid transport system permease protein
VSRLSLPQGTLARHLLLALVAAVILYFVTVTSPAFSNFRFAQIAYFLIAAAGLTVLTGLNGQLSLGHGGLMAIGGYTTGLMLKHAGSTPLIGILALSVLTTTIVGVVVGISAARLRGPYLAGVTLALALALPDIATKYESTFGGEQGLAVTPPTPPAFLSSMPLERWFAWIAFAAAIVTLVLLANLRRSRVGRVWQAVRDDEVASALAGIRVARTQVRAFVVSAACAGAAGSLFVYSANLAAPSQFDITLSLQLVTAIVIGGLGTLSGAVWGSLLLVYLPSWSDDLAKALSLSSEVKDNLPPAIYGFTLIVAMLLFPRGIQGALNDVWRRLRPRLPGQAEQAPGRTDERAEVVTDSGPSSAIEPAQMEGE